MVRYSEWERFEARPDVRGLVDTIIAASLCSTVTFSVIPVAEIHDKSTIKLRVYQFTYSHLGCDFIVSDSKFHKEGKYQIEYKTS
jgi:hypothetical protein